MKKGKIIDTSTDKFYLECTNQEQSEILKNMENTWGPHRLSTGKWYGEVQYCPKCEAIRITSCHACGCGYCYTCNYRFSCYAFNTDTFTITDKQADDMVVRFDLEKLQ
jgi:hypothetical protein